MAKKHIRKRKKDSALHWIKDHFVPNARNGHVPHYFRTGSLVALALTVLILHGAYFGVTRIVFQSTDFLASVLPSVLVSLANEDRAANGVGSLEEDPELSAAAQLKANDMAEKGYFSHKTPDGKEPWYWFQLAGYQYEHAGENLAVHFTDSEEVEEAWMASPTHRANIIKPVYTKIGIGIAKGNFEGRNTTFVVQFFATPKAVAAPVVTPVAQEPQAPIKKPESVAIGSETPLVTTDTGVVVLGSEDMPVAPTPPVRDSITLYERVMAELTSPGTMLKSALIGFLSLTLLALLFGMLRRFSIPHPAVIMGGTALTVMFLGALYLNASLIVPATLPTDQTANAISAFAP